VKLFIAALLALSANAADPLKYYRSRAGGFSFTYPPQFSLKASKGEVSVFARKQDEDPCFKIEIKPLEGLTTHVKGLGEYKYDPKAKEWSLLPGYDAESVRRLTVSRLTKAKFPAYVYINPMANAYRVETILAEDRALVVHYLDSASTDVRQVNQMIGESLRLSFKPVEASIAEPEPADLR
jgi:hypothetical protein